MIEVMVCADGNPSDFIETDRLPIEGELLYFDRWQGTDRAVLLRVGMIIHRQGLPALVITRDVPQPEQEDIARLLKMRRHVDSLVTEQPSPPTTPLVGSQPDRIAELERQVQELTKAASSWDPLVVAKLKVEIVELKAEVDKLRARAGTCSEYRQNETHIAKWLRLVADHLEKGGIPYVLASDVPIRNPDRPCSDEIIETFSVVLSKPWGG